MKQPISTLIFFLSLINSIAQVLIRSPEDFWTWEVYIHFEEYPMMAARMTFIECFLVILEFLSSLIIAQTWSTRLISSFDSVPIKCIFLRISLYYPNVTFDSGCSPTPTSSDRSSKSLKNFLISIFCETFEDFMSCFSLDFSLDPLHWLLFLQWKTSLESHVEWDLFTFLLRAFT